MQLNHQPESPSDLLDEMMALRDAIQIEAEVRFERWLPQIKRPRFVPSARNLSHYLALRHHDLRDLQAALRPWGLSSLGRIEGQVMANLNAVIATLARLSNRNPGIYPSHPTHDDFREGKALLDNETERVLGPQPDKRWTRMMVTMSSEAATDPALVQRLVEHGMNVARINCAHDTPDDWEAMIAHIRAAEKATGRTCRVAMDLAGPKSRTADIIQPAKKHRLYRGDHLLLTAETPQPDPRFPVQVRCTLPEAFENVTEGENVWFDDGKIGAIVREKLPGALHLEVFAARDKGDRLREDKGVNFPETLLEIAPLTPKDKGDLDFILEYADIINYSFVQTPADIRLLQDEIEARQPNRQIALVAKIETAQAVEELPDLIITGAGRQPFGVMIARGDLAIELGFERMAEMQEEILWICEAAHIPATWATQVLENLAKEGRPSRAEITDAAMAERAECVMLNKGPYIIDAMDILNSVLMRMESHQQKKFTQLRALRSW